MEDKIKEIEENDFKGIIIEVKIMKLKALFQNHE